MRPPLALGAISLLALLGCNDTVLVPVACGSGSDDYPFCPGGRDLGDDGGADGACTPDCASKICGESDGCGGTCTTECTQVAPSWSKRFGSSQNDVGNGVTIDDAGIVSVTGYFDRAVDFGGDLLTSAGFYDIVAASYDLTGTHQTSSRYGGSPSDIGYGVAVDNGGNVAITGFFYDEVDFGGDLLTSAGNDDVFLASHEPNGTHRWSKRFGDSASDVGYGVAVDSAGNVTVAGVFQGSVDFGGGPLTSAGSFDIFIASYDSLGTYRWSHRFGGPWNDSARGVSVDGNGNVVMTGSFEESIDFGGGVLSSAGTSDVFVASYDANGVHRWSKRFGGAFQDAGRSVAVDGAGNVLVTGSAQGSVDFGGGALPSAGGTGIFLASYEADGTHRWAHHFDGSTAGISGGVAADNSGTVTIAGAFQGTADFGGGPLTSAGNSDVYVASYDRDGAHRWSRRFGGPMSDLAHSVAVDETGSVVVVGSFLGTAIFGGDPLTSAGGMDLILFQLVEQR